MGKRGPIKRKGNPTSVRFEPELKARLEESAQVAGRSFGEEISSRLRASYSAIEFNLPETKALAYAIGLALEVEQSRTGINWFGNQWAFRRATAAINEVLEYFEPGGDADVVPSDAKPLRRLRALGLDNLVELSIDDLKNHELAKRSGTTAVAMLEAVAQGKLERLAALRPIAVVAKEMLEKLEGDNLAIKELAKPVLRALGDWSPMDPENDDDD